MKSSGPFASIQQLRLKHALVPTKPATRDARVYCCATVPIYSLHNETLQTCDGNQDAELDGSLVSVHIVLHPHYFL